MKVIRNKTMVFEDYFFNEKTMSVVSTKNGSVVVIEKIKERRIPTWKLYQNGVAYLVTLAEILEFTLGFKPAREPSSL